jgi:formylglycine-generating enzyme required for sulfatase activity
VTQGEWGAVMGENTANLPECGADCPINNVTFIQAIEFLNRTSRRDGYEPCYRGLELTSHDCRGYRLPTEAEWEYAARAGSTAMTHGGTITSSTCRPLDAVLDPIAWYCGNSGSAIKGCWDLREHGGAECAAIHPVAQKRPNAWGLYDMLGNVWEWTNDRYAADYYAKSPAIDPLGPDQASDRHAIRGGGWFYFAATVRAAKRYQLRLDDPLHPNIGLRPARTAGDTR